MMPGQVSMAHMHSRTGNYKKGSTNCTTSRTSHSQQRWRGHEQPHTEISAIHRTVQNSKSVQAENWLGGLKAGVGDRSEDLVRPRLLFCDQTTTLE